jgi:site-specific recombinase XerD
LKSIGAPKGSRIPVPVSKLLNKLSISELVALSKLSKSYICQVKNGKRPPSEKLIQAILDTDKPCKLCKKIVDTVTTIDLFLNSRQDGISAATLEFYNKYLSKAIPVIGLTPNPNEITKYFASLTCTVGGKHAYYRAISVFFHWLYSPRSGMELQRQNNPIDLVEPPKRAKLLLPCLNKEQVLLLLDKSSCNRDKAIIALFIESGLRLSELLNIRIQDISWESHIIKVLGKGNKEGLAPFGILTELYLKKWLNVYKPKENDTIWDIGFWGIKSMLRDLGEHTGLQCNPHTFRRTFAVLLRKAGIDSLTIQQLGRWESIEMVQRYTRSFAFEDSMKFYKAPLSGL